MNKPVYDESIGGIKAAVWRNETTEGKVSFSVTFQRSYKSGNEWKTTNSYYVDNLPVLKILLGNCYTWIKTKGPKAAISNSDTN